MDTTKRIASALGRGGNILGSWRASFAMETRIRDWVNSNPQPSWAALPEEFRNYIEKVEAHE